MMITDYNQGRDREQGAGEGGGDEGERLSHHRRLRQHAQQGSRLR